MTPNLIFEAAIRDMEAGRLSSSCGHPAREPDFLQANAYSEPGYDNPASGIILTNWNEYPDKLVKILEQHGFETEWSDEWATCDHCEGLVRTSPNHYGWRPSYFQDGSGILCRNCLPDFLDDYEAYLLNNPRKADYLDVDWQSRGFSKLNEESFEAGLHPYQTDDPKEIAKKVPMNHDYLFTVPSVGQFDTHFDLWVRPRD